MAEIALQFIQSTEKELYSMAYTIWENPEAPFQEYRASALLGSYLAKEGFYVEQGAFGIPTALRASWGKGHPVIGLLGEYDALPGLSQEAVPQRSPIPSVGYGHGCGHNLIGVAHAAAAVAIKREMEKKGLAGTIVYYGCPAEELLTGKGLMAQGGAFRELDAHVAFHPGRATYVMLGRHTGVYAAKFHFSGRAAHAGGEPQNGRSALDAAELMNVGANYLREHVSSDVRIHYIISEGGVAPNIVPANATTYYYVRALEIDNLRDTFRRVVRCAQGAAHMTETQLRMEKLGGCYPTLNNQALSKVLDSALRETPQITYTEKELAFAHALNQATPEVYEKARVGLPQGSEIALGCNAPVLTDCFGSSDVGDVEHIAPGARFYVAAWNLGAPSHSWQVSACVGMSIGMKAMVFGARAMAIWGLKLLETPEIIKLARTEFQEAMAGKKYAPLIPSEYSFENR